MKEQNKSRNVELCQEYFKDYRTNLNYNIGLILKEIAEDKV